ncbi:citrate synthase [Actinoplanes sp. SE50]|uniref:citrate/2-methylcitrate synthase n=1 Tax=unclassified Actinoplanes TaxID=2626549 RepID=UPI00023EBD0C|nr:MULTISPECIES: citrate/2-methylcitrate synthase [unclassified Actinoplanes]AEV83453.1 citrate synthase [Actinoplanes sp. SE50/110]ATO81846.1 citrate synthase [Actinoplanes sp. SE50]SLL99254.1 citrate synthase [Actinoplanes sp. SE50/110]
MSEQLLTTDQVAQRLGVKPATVYAYVSRGLLPSRRNAAGKGSLFAKADVDALLAGRKRATPNIQTGITLIRDGALFYRGRDATELARTSTYEAVATLLWTGPHDPEPGLDGGGALEPAPFAVSRASLALAERVGALLPATARLTDRLRVTVAAIAAADPFRFDTSPAAVVTTGRTLIATMVAALPLRSAREPVDILRSDPSAPTGAGGPGSIAELLWPRLTGEPMTEVGRRVLEAALILLADHDIAASTLAARVAASTRAHPYAVVSAGLAALDGPLHGAASEYVHPLLVEALAGADPVAIISERLRVSGGIPGFGHLLYQNGDPRAITILRLLGDHPARRAATALADAVQARSGIHPNIDLALATLTLHFGMPSDAGEAIFAIARTAGWLAHALEEYANHPVRFRPTGQYSGRPPA